MRLGCTGCLGTLLALALFVGALVGVVWAGLALLQEPDIHQVETSAADGFRAQAKLYAIASPGRGVLARHPRGEVVALSEREVNAFLTRHLADLADLRITSPVVHLGGDGLVDIAGRVKLADTLSDAPLAPLAGALPARWLDQPVWLRLRTRVRVEAGKGERRYLRVGVERFYLGRLRLPTVLLWHLLNPATLRVFSWPLPATVERVTVEAQRVLIATASSPPRSGAGDRR